MDGIGFIANLHATTLDPQASTSLLLKPVRSQCRASSNGSISGKAKSFVSRSRSFFSASSSSSVATRTSISSSSRTISDHGHGGYHKRSSMYESHSLFNSSSSSRLPSEEQPRSPNHSDPSSSSNVRRMEDSVSHSTASKHQSGGSTESNFDAQLDATWISTLVDNGYISPPQSLPPDLPRLSQDANLNSDMEPSRASSMLDRDMVSISHDDSPRLLQPVLQPLLSLSIAEQLAFSLEDDAHKPWLADCQNLLHPQLIPGFARIAQPRQHYRRRPHTAKT
ncbi:uncharacterized protein UTRI_01332_B [Ustilago trichophora]|uniref:Uncharacterized protein n=1 Tax=Ustilago trichophora TaxID=86804 RepID=A0A5C3DXQ6_9BASI|nr:uncharacterized protein UTRI_01332_B [Ustilago trichophora]